MQNEDPRFTPFHNLLFLALILAVLVAWVQTGVVDPLEKRLERIEAQQAALLKQQGEVRQSQRYLYKSAVRTELYLANRP